jgi:uncharacterized membrane protein SpoIIM required for sporulation
MMTPLRFEEMYEEEWTELEALLDAVRGRKGSIPPPATVSGARLAGLYRRVCEHLALARARFYPAHLIDRLERLTGDAHQLIYYRREFGLARLREIIAADFPRAIRQHAAYVAAAAAAFVLPTVLIGCLVYGRPELILSVVSVEQAASFEEMYSPAADSIGRERSAGSDWIMFGHYIRNNIGVAFQCFAGGLFAGIGSLFFLGYNGAFGGAVAGYLTERGLSSTFYSFVATHAAFELTAIVLSGAAGLRVGFALLDPGRLTRAQALVVATRESAVLLYGVTALLLVAAAVEAFWSSATWLPPAVKYGVAAVCWTAMFGYCAFQGRRAD